MKNLFNLIFLSTLLSLVIGCGSRRGTSPKIITAQTGLNPTQQKVVNLHNEKRHHYFDDSDLRYSFGLEMDAQDYANKLAENGTFGHDPYNHQKGYGENLYAHTQSTPVTIEEAMRQWYDAEMPFYNYEDGTCAEGYDSKGRRVSCGHYTQIIWKNTHEVGCATAQYQRGRFKGGYVYVCKYKKAGNVIFNGVRQRPY